MTNTPDSQRGKSTVSETVEKFSFGSGHAYADNAEFASKGLRFDILEIKFEPGRGYEGHDRWLVTVKVADREPEHAQSRVESRPRSAAPRCSGAPRTRRQDRPTCGCAIPARHTTSRRATANE